MLVYADVDDLEGWVQDDVPDNADLLIRSASLLVRRATAGDYYDVDVAGKPSDVDLLQAFNDAVCAQVASWVALGIDPAAGAGGAVTAAVASSSLLSGSVTYNTSATTSTPIVAARIAAATALCDESIQILQQAGAAASAVWSFG